ncbi:MAG: pilin [Patescibacteria group bacterium]|nr:pilin [Patescibacteria group bacterium]
MSKKIIIIFFLAISVFWPTIVFGQAQTSATNPLCWTKELCKQERDKYGVSGADSGWVQEEPCLGDWGKCLPGAVTKAEVSFGGSSQFTDIGQYIKTIYNYSLVIIGILATVIIIISGAQWITSAGNTETISSAKKKITGAVIGLVIAYMSYNILNSINPATVNLRLPQVWLLRSVPLPPKWCQEVQLQVAGASLPDAFKVTKEYVKFAKDQYNTNLSPDVPFKQSETLCGVQFESPAGGYCFGSVCDGLSPSSNDADIKNKICGKDFPCACYPKKSSSDMSINVCQPSSLGGTINMNGKNKIEDWYVDYITLYALCHVGEQYSVRRVDYSDPDEDNADYGLTAHTDNNADCAFAPGSGGSQGGTPLLSGYFLAVEVNDAGSVISQDDTWVLGKKSCGNGGKPIVGANMASFAPLADPSNAKEYTLTLGVMAEMMAGGDLWGASDLAKGVTCDIVTNVPPYNIGLENSDLKDGVFYRP